MAEYNIQMNRYVSASDSYDQLFPKTKTIDVVDQNGDNLDTLLGEKIDYDEKGAANGVASLGADGKVPSSQLPATGYSKDETLTAATAALYGLPNTAVPDDVFAWLGKYNEHCWKKTSITPIFENLSSDVAIIRGTETRSILYSSNLTTDSNGNILLENPSTYTTQGNEDAAIYIANLAPVYITNGYVDNSAIYFVPEGSTGGTANEVTVAWNGSYVVLHREVAYVTIPAKKVVGMTRGDSTFVFSTNRSAYPDSGIQDGYEYEYIGVPFDNLTKDHFKIETGSYVGTGTYGARNPNSLTFGFVPKLVVIKTKAGNNGIATDAMIAIQGMTSSMQLTNYTSSYLVNITWNGNTMSWYNDSNANIQLNNSGIEYLYLAIG